MQHYKVTMSVHFHKLVPVLIQPLMLPGCTPPASTGVHVQITQNFISAASNLFFELSFTYNRGGYNCQRGGHIIIHAHPQNFTSRVCQKRKLQVTLN